MHRLALAACGIAALSLSLPFVAAAEPYHEYLARLKAICSVECLQPRQFQRTARKRGLGQTDELALIMDVAHIVREDDTYELHNINLESNHFNDLIDLESAGIDVSSRTGVGALPRGRRAKNHPNLIIVELDEEAVRELLAPAGFAATGVNIAGSKASADIVVEGARDRPLARPSLIDLTQLLRNRRIVVRGTPQLEAVTVGARRDFRRKQVRLVVDDLDDLAVLPRFDPPE